MDLVKNFADDVKARHEIGSGIPKEDTHGIAHLGFQSTLLAKRPCAPVENHKIRCLLRHFVDGDLEDAALGSISLEINIALHDVEFAVHLRPASGWLDDHETVHSVRKMIGNHRRRAVIDKDAGVHGLELEHARRAGRGLGHLAAATGSEHAMRVDAVAHWTVESILQGELDGISLADADHRTRHGSIKGPIMITDSVGEEPGDRPGFQLDMNRRRLFPVDRRSNRGRGQPLELRGQNLGLGRHGSRRRGGRGVLRLLRLDAGGIPRRA